MEIGPSIYGCVHFNKPLDELTCVVFEELKDHSLHGSPLFPQGPLLFSLDAQHSLLVHPELVDPEKLMEV